MGKNILKKVQKEIDHILELEDGLSNHDKEELNKLLLQKLEIESQLVHLSDDLRKLIIDNDIDGE
jgi:hypothetical protein